MVSRSPGYGNCHKAWGYLPSHSGNEWCCDRYNPVRRDSAFHAKLIHVAGAGDEDYDQAGLPSFASGCKTDSIVGCSPNRCCSEWLCRNTRHTQGRISPATWILSALVVDESRRNDVPLSRGVFWCLPLRSVRASFAHVLARLYPPLCQ